MSTKTVNNMGSFLKENTLVLMFTIAMLLILVLPSSYSFVPDKQSFSITFFSLTLEALSFMLIGSLVSGFIEEFVSREQMEKLLRGKNPLVTAMIAGATGAFFPVCECAIVPVTRRLLNKGVSLAAAIAFLLAGPIVNPIVGWSTYIAYQNNWSITIARLGLGYIIAVSVALFIHVLFKNKDVLVTIKSSAHHHHANNLPPTVLSRIIRALSFGRDDFIDVARYLVAGTFIASYLRTMVPMSWFEQLNTVPVVGILIMMLLAVMLNLCSEADAFVAASFKVVIPISSQLAFMVLGPMFDIKLLLMYKAIFKRKLIITLASTIIITVFIVILLYHYILGGIHV